MARHFSNAFYYSLDFVLSTKSPEHTDDFEAFPSIAPQSQLWVQELLQ